MGKFLKDCRQFVRVIFINSLKIYEIFQLSEMIVLCEANPKVNFNFILNVT